MNVSYVHTLPGKKQKLHDACTHSSALMCCSCTHARHFNLCNDWVPHVLQQSSTMSKRLTCALQSQSACHSITQNYTWRDMCVRITCYSLKGDNHSIFIYTNLVSISAPILMRYLTTRWWPFSLARSNGVILSMSSSLRETGHACIKASTHSRLPNLVILLKLRDYW